uniref:Peptidase A1 domain-containing protein n=1 Tax=Panagrolaimus sp. PS1159 TaxID=55785 RepID=A0AC35FVU5_9BILA
MKLLILLAVIGCVAAASDVYQLPLIRVESRKTKMIKAGTWDAYFKDKQLLSQSLNESMADFDEVEYIGMAYIGTPAQAFKFHYDLTDYHFWVTDKKCGPRNAMTEPPHCPSFCSMPGGSSFCKESCKNQGNASDDDDDNVEQICNQKSKYGLTESSTAYLPQNYANGYLDYEFGYIYLTSGLTDKIRLGAFNSKNNTLNQPSAYFSQTKEMSPVFRDTPFDGIFGLNYMSLFVLQVVALMDKPMFTVYLQDTKKKYNVPGGYITFGGLDEEHCSPTIDSPNITPSHTFMINNVSFNTIEPPTIPLPNYWYVKLDTARTSIMGPPEIIKNLKKAAGANDDGIIDCDAEFGDLNIQSNSKFYTIPAKHLIIHNPDGSCSIALDSMPPNISQYWIFGVPWFKSYCTVYTAENYKIDVGFAKVVA